MEEENQNIDEQDEETDKDDAVCKMQGLDLILKSINCEKYKSVFEKYGINEQTMLHLTTKDLEYLKVDNKDIQTLLTAVEVLNKTLNLSETQLSNDEIRKLQSNICGQLGTIVIILNHIHCSIANNANNFNDVLIDNYLSSVDAALMIKPFMRAEEKEIEKTLKNVFKIKNKRSTISVSIVTIVCVACLFGLALKRNYSFIIPALPNFVHQMKS